MNMKILAQTTQQTKAAPEAIFALWSDINHWTDYDNGIEWAKLTDSFKAGSHYTLKPKGGPVVKATIRIVEPNQRYIDVSHLLGAKLQFDHSITQQTGVTSVHIVMTISGPLRWVWTQILGKNQQADLEQSTSSLIAKAEKIT
jgi:hypothetical protein